MMEIKLYTFLLLNFIVAFVSDIILNDLSTNYNIISSLKPYFRNESILVSAFYAGLTIEFGLLVTIMIYFSMFHKLLPNNATMVIYFCIIAFVVGYITDYLIYKWHIFGNRLDTYYKELGYGFWGSIAFLFSIFISYFIQIKIIPNL
jgi:uncharacterized membrane protein YGL010W